MNQTSGLKPQAERILRLAQRVREGEILLPKFQRDNVWEKRRIRDLLDSIMKGYPIGSILLWRTEEKLRSERNIADLELTFQPRKEVSYLLDGQQRLSTICGALFWNGSDPKSKWNLAYDLSTCNFVHLESLDEPPAPRIRLNRVSESSKFGRYLAQKFNDVEHADLELWLKRADALVDEFNDYELATVTIESMSLKAVGPIFERINSKGKTLTIVDLMRAATWSDEFDLVDSIRDIIKGLSDRNFSAIKEKVVLRNISTASGSGFTAGNIQQLRESTVDELKLAVEITRESYKKAIDFIRSRLKIPGLVWVPYTNQLVLLVELFRQIPNPNAAQYRVIESWFWRTSLSQYFQGWDTGDMAVALKSVTDFANGNAPSIAVPKPLGDETIWDSTAYNSRNATTKLLGAILAKQGPRDLLTSNPIDLAHALSKDNRKEFHHIFPKDFLIKTKGYELPDANVLANFTFLTSRSNKKIRNRPPSEYMQDVIKEAGPHLKQVLDANLISDAAFQAALADDYDKFVTERARTIHEALLNAIGSDIVLNSTDITPEVAVPLPEDDFLVEEESGDEGSEDPDDNDEFEDNDDEEGTFGPGGTLPIF